jgi:hypothetical protein
VSLDGPAAGYIYDPLVIPQSPIGCEWDGSDYSSVYIRIYRSGSRKQYRRGSIHHIDPRHIA